MYIKQLPMLITVPEGASTEAVVHRVQGVLLGAVKNKPQAWAPIISAVSISLQVLICNCHISCSTFIL